MTSHRWTERIADGLSLLVTIGAALGVGALIIHATSPAPAKALHAFFLGPFSSGFFLGNMLQAATPLMLTGLGLVVAFRAGAVNLGAEGQVYMGGLVGAALLLSSPGGAAWMLPLAILASAATGAVFAGLSGWLRTRFGASEVITSFLIGAVLIHAFDFLLRRFLVDPTAGFPTTEALPAAYRMARLLPPSNLNVGFFIALGLIVVVTFLLFRTGLGYELRMTGSNPRFARFSGLPVGRTLIVAMALSGALAGLAALFEVMGVHGRLLTGFSNGIGWNGLTVALVARLHPLGVVPAALMFGYLHTGAGAASLLAEVSPQVAAIIRSLILFLITAQALSMWIRRWWLQARAKRPSDGVGPIHPEGRQW